MSISIQPPQPGDLITSSFVKQLIDQLKALDVRISALEGQAPGIGGNLAIISLSASDLDIGAELRIFGVNFGLPSENVVTFDGQNPVRQFKPGSGDKLLILDVPPLSFSGDARVFQVTVSNPRGFDQKLLTVHMPKLTIPTGTLTVGSPQFPAQKIVVPASGSVDATFGFTLTVSATMDEVYNVMPTYPQGWSAVLVTDMTGKTVLQQPPGQPAPPPWKLPIPKPPNGLHDTIVPVFVRLTIPSTANPAVGGSVGLKVASVNNPEFTAHPFSVDFPLNATLPNSQTLTISVAAVGGEDARSLDDTIFAVPTRATQDLDQVTFKVQKMSANTKYHVKLAWQDGNSHGWTASLDGAGAMESPPNTPLVGPGDALVPVVIAGAATATDATLIFTVQKLPAVDPITTSTDYGIANQVIKPSK
ncbi:MAG TPA: hypothetical protein VF516_34640 [Kofleriaceae bacterium]